MMQSQNDIAQSDDCVQQDEDEGVAYRGKIMKTKTFVLMPQLVTYL